MISIHALLAESDDCRRTINRALKIFLSTLSLRRATEINYNGTWVAIISIHALLAESDYFSPRHLHADAHFYPRSPCGERQCGPVGCSAGEDFYPRSPCGERLSGIVDGFTSALFLSTLSLRRATACFRHG